jgi:hypothetical protein
VGEIEGAACQKEEEEDTGRRRWMSGGATRWEEENIDEVTCSSYRVTGL